MAKIIEPGEKIYTCRDCGCKFTIEKDDIKEDDMTMDEYGFLGILPLLRHCRTTRCPQCKTKIVIEWKGL